MLGLKKGVESDDSPDLADGQAVLRCYPVDGLVSDASFALLNHVQRMQQMIFQRCVAMFLHGFPRVKDCARSRSSRPVSKVAPAGRINSLCQLNGFILRKFNHFVAADPFFWHFREKVVERADVIVE